LQIHPQSAAPRNLFAFGMFGFSSRPQVSDGRGVFRMHVDRPGKWRLQVSPVVASPSGFVSPSFLRNLGLGNLSFTIDVKEPAVGEPEAQTFVLELDKAQLDAIEVCIQETKIAMENATIRK
jgi:hypothetical protein